MLRCPFSRLCPGGHDIDFSRGSLHPSSATLGPTKFIYTTKFILILFYQPQTYTESDLEELIFNMWTPRTPWHSDKQSMQYITQYISNSEKSVAELVLVAMVEIVLVKNPKEYLLSAHRIPGMVINGFKYIISFKL